MCILGEEPAVRLGEHLIHGLLRQVYELSEELCSKEEEEAEVGKSDYMLLLSPTFFFL